MIAAGEELYVIVNNRRMCLVCGRSFNPNNGYDRATHARGHVSSGQVREFARKGRYVFELTDTGAAAVNKRMEKES